MRDGHNESRRAGIGDLDGAAVDEEALVAALELAAGVVATVAVSFVERASVQAGKLQRSSRHRVHLRRDAPIAGIAWAHSSTQLRVVQLD